MNAPSINIISGCPGIGKTTIAARLASASPSGVHIVSDVFYDFLTKRVLQILKESHGQNTTVVRATARAAGTFADGGYEVFLEGVFGPWFVPLLADELRGQLVNYLILHAPLEVVLERSMARPEPGREEIVRQMHSEFSRSTEFDSHILDTSMLSVEQTVEAVGRDLLTERYRLEGAMD